MAELEKGMDIRRGDASLAYDDGRGNFCDAVCGEKMLGGFDAMIPLRGVNFL